jgi:putative addiction module killer protein
MAREAQPRQIEIYISEDGGKPFAEWIESVRDRGIRNRILRRVDRMEQGNLGDHRGVGEGVLELRLHFGAGYRVYFAEDGETLILLLCGGDKSTQPKDIEQAKAYWSDYKERKP